MSWIEANKDEGPWDFNEQGDKWGYINNPNWTDSPAHTDRHLPCGHWHKRFVSYENIIAGKWVAAMYQPNTPYIYLYDITYKNVVKLEIATVAPAASLIEILSLESLYDLNYDMGQGNPGAQRGGYCINKSGTRLWYLFSESTGDRSDCQLIEVDISQSTMSIVKKTSFPNLVPSDPWPGANECISDGCANNDYVYWCTDRLSGRIIKITASDHSITDDHLFSFELLGCATNLEGINTIDISGNNLYWTYVLDHIACTPIYNACAHFVVSDLDLNISLDLPQCDSGFSTPKDLNMLRILSGRLYQHRAFYGPSGPLEYKTLLGVSLTNVAVQQLQNFLGVYKGNLFVLSHDHSVGHPGYLWCLTIEGLTELKKLDVSYYTGQSPQDWDWTSVSTLNEQTGVIIIVNYNNTTNKNSVVCFRADDSLEMFSDELISYRIITNKQELLDEPQVWTI